MYPITIINDPADLSGSDEYFPAEDQTLADWLIDHYGPDGIPVPHMVFVGPDHLDLADFEAANQVPAAPVYIFQRPQGLDPITAIIITAIAVVAAVAVALLMPIPNLSSDGRQQRRSPNNALTGQTNIARLLDRIPDIFGKQTSYPDLIAPTVREYRNHVLYQTENMCIGRGYYLLERFRQGQTLISSISGSTVDVFPPGQAPDRLLKTRQSNEVSGQLMRGPNEERSATLDGTFTVAYTAGVDDEAVVTDPGGTAFGNFEAGDSVDFSEVWSNDGSADFDLSGLYTVSAATAGALTIEQVSTENPNWTNFTSTPTNVLTSTGGQPLNPVIQVPNTSPIVGPFVVPGDNNDEIWIDLEAPKGLAQGSELNKNRTIFLFWRFEEIDDNDQPTGPFFDYVVELTDNERDARFWTFKIQDGDGSVGAFVPGQRYRTTGQRTSPSDPTEVTIVDDIKWTRLAGIEDITSPDDTDTTRVQIETRASAQVAALQERQFNVEATRKVVTYANGQVVGDIATGVGLTPSRRFADVLLHYMLDPKLAARSLSSLDVAEVYAIQDRLDAVFDGAKGEFSYTFDDQNTPALEEMRLIARAPRGFLYHLGSQFSVIRDEEQPIPRGLLNRRNKSPQPEKQSVSFNLPLDFDGVQLEYSDIEDNVARTIVLPDDLPADDENFGQPNTVNPLKIDGSGIRQYPQAWDRAQFEYRRLIYKRRSVEVQATEDALLLPLNARVQHVNGTRIASESSDGEILRVDGLQCFTDQRCTFDVDKRYSVTLRDPEGNAATPIRVTPLPNDGCGFVLSRAPGFDILTRQKDRVQRGTLFSFGPDGTELAEAFLVQRKTPAGDGYVRLELINYDARYYGADNQEPPPKG